MYAAIEAAAKEGLLIAQQQEQQHGVQPQLPQQQLELMHAQSVLVREQSVALLQMQVLGLQVRRFIVGF
jgi:hypothetical protein